CRVCDNSVPRSSPGPLRRLRWPGTGTGRRYGRVMAPLTASITALTATVTVLAPVTIVNVPISTVAVAGFGLVLVWLLLRHRSLRVGRGSSLDGDDATPRRPAGTGAPESARG